MTWPKKPGHRLSRQPCNFFYISERIPCFLNGNDVSLFHRLYLEEYWMNLSTREERSHIYAALRHHLLWILLDSLPWGTPSSSFLYVAPCGFTGRGIPSWSLVGRESSTQEPQSQISHNVQRGCHAFTPSYIYRYLRTHSPPMSTTYVCPSSSCLSWLLATATPVGRRNFDPWLSITEMRLPSDMLNTFRTRSVNL